VVQKYQVNIYKDVNYFSFSANTNNNLHISNAPIWTKRPYILWGYRNKQSYKECINSIFQIHNEFGNIWTHLIGVFIFMFLFVKNIIYPIDIPYYRLTSSIYILSCIFMFGSSSFFHLISSNSSLVYERALRVDIIGITAITISTYIVGIRYCLWCYTDIAHIYYIIIGFLGFIAIGWSLIPSLIKNFTFSVCFFALFTSFSLIIIYHWFIIIGESGYEQKDVFLWKYLNTYITYAIGFIFFFTGFPERMFPGRLDFIGHSHQIWHILIVLGTIQYYIAIKAYATYWSSNYCIAY